MPLPRNVSPVSLSPASARNIQTRSAILLNSDADVAPPRKLTPAFYGCYDWHSSVHGHWLLARLVKTFPDAPFAKPAREALAQKSHRGKPETGSRLLARRGSRKFRAAVRNGLVAPARRSNCASGTIHKRARCSAICAPLEDAVRDALEEPGSQNFLIRFGSGSTTNPPSRSGSCSITPAPRRTRSSRNWSAAKTRRIFSRKTRIARWIMSHPARIFFRPVWAKRMRCGASWHRTSSQSGWANFCRTFRRRPRPIGCRSRFRPIRAIRSWRISMG